MISDTKSAVLTLKYIFFNLFPPSIILNNPFVDIWAMFSGTLVK